MVNSTQALTALEALAESLPGDIDAGIISGDYNRRYYTGLRSSAGILIVTREKCRLIIDSRYFEQAQRTVKNCDVILQDKLYEQLTEIFNEQGVKTAAVESDICTVRDLARYREELPGVNLLEDDRFPRLIAGQRMRKSTAETQCIRAAQDIADRTFAHILEWIKPGKTEHEIALELEFYGRRLGAEGAAFPFIVASGKNSSMPHASPSGKPVEHGDLVTMDFGFVAEGYCSDMTRTVAIGQVSERQREVYNTVLRAQESGFQKIRPGAICQDADAAARELIDASPFNGCFCHSLGHSIGLEVHEPPRLGQACETPLETGMVLTVEPGIYLPGEFGVRIEDMVAVTGNGYENLTRSPKELIVL